MSLDAYVLGGPVGALLGFVAGFLVLAEGLLPGLAWTQPSSGNW